MKLKEARSPYFQWLTNNRIYLRHISFVADNVALLGFLLGAHPDAARLLDLTNELSERLNLPEAIDFQLSPRNLTAIHNTVTKNKFGFKAIAVETDGKMAGAVWEAFFRLGDPKVEKHKWPITGNLLFVPMYKTTSWTSENISTMAKLHVQTISKLEQIFVENIYDIDTPVTFKGPGGMENQSTLREAIQTSTNSVGDANVVHSSGWFIGRGHAPNNSRKADTCNRPNRNKCKQNLRRIRSCTYTGTKSSGREPNGPGFA